MKKCPKCSRTYADDGFTFCLEDGALLSAPYEPSKEETLNIIQSAGPPPTAVLPEKKTGGQEVPPTVMSGSAPKNNDETKAHVPIQLESLNSRRTSPVKYVVIGLVALVIVVGALGFVGFYLAGTSNCPKLVIKCDPSNTTLYCELAKDTSHTFNHINDKPISGALSSRSVILLQAAPLPEGITRVTWSASSGTVRSNHSQLSLDTTGLEGKTITVKANISSNSWLCSTTVSSSFVVPSGFAPAR